MRLAVTGASGFVGAAVHRAALARGWQVYGFGRRPTGLPGYRRWDLTQGPLPDPPEVDAVVHTAGAVTDWGPPAPIWLSNVDGVRSVLATFPTARLVHLSTASVYDPYTPTVHAREEAAPVRRYGTAYAASKAAAERLLTGRADTVILRPHAVYGPGDPTLLPRILSAIRGETLWIVGDGTCRHSLTSIGNLVSATLLACESQAPQGVYNVADAEPVTLLDALREFLEQRGITAGVTHLPVRPARALATVAELTYRLLRRPEPPRLTRYTISHLAMERTLDITAARERLGYQPTPTSFAGAASW